MNIIYLKNGFTYYTESISRAESGKIVFDTIDKKGIKVHRELSTDQIGEIATIEETLEEFRARKNEEEK